MQVLQRKEQEQLVLTFERDYGKLIMEYNNCGIEKQKFRQNAINLAEQIKKAAVPAYFEEDILDFLESLSTSIEQVAKVN